jgi:hypothetical protein
VGRISALDGYYTLNSRRVAVTLAVLALHVALIMMISHRPERLVDVADTTSIWLPISLEERTWEPVQIQKKPIPQTSQITPRHAAARAPKVDQPALAEASPDKNGSSGDAGATPAAAASKPAPPTDWYAEIEPSAQALEQHNNMSGRSFTVPKQPALSTAPQKAPCPYERCEPSWGESPGVFKPSLQSKAGRIETIPIPTTTRSNGSQNMADSESVLWVNNWCYNILVSPDPQRQGTYKCFVPLGGDYGSGRSVRPYGRQWACAITR